MHLKTCLYQVAWPLAGEDEFRPHMTGRPLLPGEKSVWPVYDPRVGFRHRDGRPACCGAPLRHRGRRRRLVVTCGFVATERGGGPTGPRRAMEQLRPSARTCGRADFAPPLPSWSAQARPVSERVLHRGARPSTEGADVVEGESERWEAGSLRGERVDQRDQLGLHLVEPGDGQSRVGREPFHAHQHDVKSADETAVLFQSRAEIGVSRAMASDRFAVGVDHRLADVPLLLVSPTPEPSGRPLSGAEDWYVDNRRCGEEVERPTGFRKVARQLPPGGNLLYLSAAGDAVRSFSESSGDDHTDEKKGQPVQGYSEVQPYPQVVEPNAVESGKLAVVRGAGPDQPFIGTQHPPSRQVSSQRPRLGEVVGGTLIVFGHRHSPVDSSRRDEETQGYDVHRELLLDDQTAQGGRDDEQEVRQRGALGLALPQLLTVLLPVGAYRFFRYLDHQTPS